MTYQNLFPCTPHLYWTTSTPSFRSGILERDEHATAQQSHLARGFATRGLGPKDRLQISVVAQLVWDIFKFRTILIDYQCISCMLFHSNAMESCHFGNFRRTDAKEED